MPRTAERSLWRAAVEALHTTLLLGFAEARTCSNEGRSLMLLDYQVRLVWILSARTCFNEGLELMLLELDFQVRVLSVDECNDVQTRIF